MATPTTAESLAALTATVDTFYYFVCAVLVFFMQLGFAMFEVGMVSSKNTRNIMIKGVIDVLVAAISYFVCGYSITYGGDGEFIGGEDFWFGDHVRGVKGWEDWFFQMAFAATAATIVSGAVAERCSLLCYLVYSIALTAFIYPVVAHWVWYGKGAWAYDDGVQDFAGSGIVHMTGGLAGIVGAAVIGPRTGRFEGPFLKVKTNPMPQHSPVFVTLGTMILWVGWYGFNTGSTLGIVGNEGTARDVVINTTLAPAACGLTCMLISMIMSKVKGKMVVSLESALSGVLGGLVSITAGCHCVQPGYAILAGVIGAPILIASSALQKQLKIDDVVDAGPVHFWCGIWGVLVVGIFGDKEYNSDLKDAGDQFGEQLKFVIVVTLWVLCTSLAVFVPLRLLGLARVSAEVEEKGLDISEHGAPDL